LRTSEIILDAGVKGRLQEALFGGGQITRDFGIMLFDKAELGSTQQNEAGGADGDRQATEL
jgi:hypothetical protein